jgi:hypothetical protein
MAARNSRDVEQVRLELEAEREGLAQAVDTLRAGVKDATNVSARIRENLPVAAGAALAAGFLLAGGIGATMRLFARRSREGDEVARFGRYAVVDRE